MSVMGEFGDSGKIVEGKNKINCVGIQKRLKNLLTCRCIVIIRQKCGSFVHRMPRFAQGINHVILAVFPPKVI
jgi:hypothetical protein